MIIDGWSCDTAPMADRTRMAGVRETALRGLEVVDVTTRRDHEYGSGWTHPRGDVRIDRNLTDAGSSYDRVSMASMDTGTILLNAFAAPSMTEATDEDMTRTTLTLIGRAFSSATEQNDEDSECLVHLVAGIIGCADTLSFGTPWSRPSMTDEKGRDVLDDRLRMLLEEHAPRRLMVQPEGSGAFASASVTAVRRRRNDPTPNAVLLLRTAARHQGLLDAIDSHMHDRRTSR